MKISIFATFVSSALLFSIAEAARHGESAFAAPAHHHLGRRSAGGSHANLNRLSKRKPNGRCKPRPTSSVVPAVPTSTPLPSTTKVVEKPTSSPPPAEPKPSPSPKPAPEPAPAANLGHSSGSSAKVSSDSGPNGSEDWFNRGLYDGGWNPPRLTIADLKVVDLAQAVKSGSSPFRACNSFIQHFYDAGGQYGIPPIMLASIAMQESSCNPETVGGNGEQGLMQLTKDKCFDAPGGNCREISFNIHRGAQYLSNTLKEFNGDVLLSIGRYNGWFKGMTLAQATAAGNNPGTCHAQNNVDYHQQFLNGWCQNIDAYNGHIRLGTVHNLDKCN